MVHLNNFISLSMWNSTSLFECEKCGCDGGLRPLEISLADWSMGAYDQPRCLPRGAGQALQCHPTLISCEILRLIE